MLRIQSAPRTANASIEFKHRQKRLLRNLYAAHLAQALLAFLLF